MRAEGKTTPVRQTGRFEIEQAFYTDLAMPDMLYARIIRARDAPGELEVVAAPELPEGYTIYTADDIPGKNSVTLGDIQTGIFASSRISYAGEPVGILVGPDLSEIDRLLEGIEVSVLPNSNRSTMPPPLAERILCAGTTAPESIYAQAEIKVDGEYSILLKPPLCAEYTGCLAAYDGHGLTVYSPSSQISQVRKTTAGVLAIPETLVTVRKTIATEHNCNSMLQNCLTAAQAALASFLQGRPVKLEYTKSEHESYVQNTLPVIISHKTAINTNGMLDAMVIQISASGGDYCPFAQEILDRLVIAASGIYRPKALKITGRIYKTPGPPVGMHFPRIDYQSFFAVESHLQKIAQTINMSPLELRNKNSAENALFRQSFPFAFNLANRDQVLQTLASVSDYSRKYTAYSLNARDRRSETRKSSADPVRGMGLAVAFEGSVFLGSEIGFADQRLEVAMEKDGSVVITSYQTSLSIQAIWTRIASEELKVPLEKIRIQGDFEYGKEPHIPEHSFDNIGVMVSLLRKCCGALQKQRFRKPLPIRVTQTITTAQRKAWNQKEFIGVPFFSASTGAAAVELEVDPYTYCVTIRHIWIVIDCGEIFSPDEAVRTIKTTARQALATLIPTQVFNSTDITISFIKQDGEARQIGNLIYRILPASYANALSQALCASISVLPLFEDTLRAEAARLSGMIQEEA
ncbi:MAG: xanthine dehydrogenase family protein molybdopterin-binding subunit [Treponema sp.]|jgi:CO/xanthine dehydrogenase Mo-binding subunit|nr:xanthine dehydrogenase family protein molybdopterin-binding subunit [Treponema sp.]